MRGALEPGPRGRVRPRWQRFLLRVLYWVAVLAASFALLVALVLLIESRDKSAVKERRAPHARPAG